MPKLNQTEFAKEVGVSKARISAAIKTGVLRDSVTVTPGAARGGNDAYEIDLQAGLREWNANRDVSRTADPDRAEIGRSHGQQLRENGGDADPNLPSYAKSKQVAAAFDAKMKQLEYLREAGKLISVDDVKAEYFKRGRILRDMIMAIPARLSAELAANGDAHSIETILVDQLASALEELGNVGAG